MTLEQTIARRVRELPREKQREVLEFVERLGATREATDRPQLRGLCAHLGVSVSEDDIRAARREMWARFPRDLPDV